jgi:ubiquinone/menaquinone biosynthesis C-methylase UbiE
MPQDDQPIDTTAAEAYEKHMVPGMFLQWTERVVALASPQPGEHVLDVACGTGVGARHAANAVGAAGKVVGLDVDAGVIDVARRTSQETGTPIEWHCASALKMPFNDAAFDLCLCLQGLQFFPDRAAGLSEIRRVLKPSGRLVASIWGPLEHNKGHQAVVEALERQSVDASAAKRACSFASAEEIRATAAHAGFMRIELHSEDGVSHFASIQSFLDGMTKGSPSTRHAVALLSKAGREQFDNDVHAALEPYLVNGELAYPMRTFILVARR